MPARKIFQSDKLTEQLVNGMTSNCARGASISEVVRKAIRDEYTPLCEHLKYHTLNLFTMLENDEDITDDVLKGICMNIMYSLKDTPLSDKYLIKRLMEPFINPNPMEQHYGYPAAVDILQDGYLKRLDEILWSLDHGYPLGARKLSERCFLVYSKWHDLYRYSEVYPCLATIIECETIYHDIDVYWLIRLIKDIDISIILERTEPISGIFPTDISLEDKCNALIYTITHYYSAKGYAYFKGDTALLEIPPELNEYFTYTESLTPAADSVSDEYYRSLLEAERQGWVIFSKLALTSKK
jgi:hypothetical protein